MRANGISSRQVNRDLVKEINSLKAQLRKLSAAMEAETNSGGVSRTLSAIETKSKEAIDSAIETAQDFIDHYSDSARETAEALTEKASDMRDAAAESLVDAVRTRPLGTLAAIVGIGFLAGYLWRRPS